MPRLIETREADQLELGDLVEMLETGGFDPDDEDSFAGYASSLRKLANNRRFVADLVIEELKQHCAGQGRRNPYTAQVIILHGGSRKFLLRANLWPALSDSVVVNSGPEPFFYGFPHDHNFSFLTVGYLGSGYWSDYYEYDYERVAGWAGEKVDMRFIERSRLSPGKVLLYRKHRDIHLQLPPDDMSMSLNIVGLSNRSEFLDQYSFSMERREIAGMVNPSSLEALILLAGHFGGENGRELVDRFAMRHPSDRMRCAALRSQASRIGDVEGRIEFFRCAAADNGGLVGAVASSEARRLAETRGWIGERPTKPAS